ncbi:MAG: hypothetical protein ACE5LV_10790 [Candidatus Aminicenantales bacterium]
MDRVKIERVEAALDSLAPHEKECRMCPRECGVDRKAGEKGFCGSGSSATLSHAVLHFGEEPVLSGCEDCAREKPAQEPRRCGSGALFFSGCNLKCCFCQNFQISWLHWGRRVSERDLSSEMLGLQEKRALNINCVSPSHILVPILRALRRALREGLDLPLVYNSNAYEKPDVLKHLEDIVDIYLPDCKYFSPTLSQRYSQARDYFRWASAALEEMHRQQPRLVYDENGIAQKGLIIRLLVLPGQEKDAEIILEWIAHNLSRSVGISVMSQFCPCFKAPAELRRPLDPQGYQNIVERALHMGFEELFIQPAAFPAEDHRIPDFSRKDPFEWK